MDDLSSNLPFSRYISPHKTLCSCILMLVIGTKVWNQVNNIQFVSTGLRTHFKFLLRCVSQYYGLAFLTRSQHFPLARIGKYLSGYYVQKCTLMRCMGCMIDKHKVSPKLNSY